MTPVDTQEQLAATIRRYWAAKGFAVKVWVEQTSSYLPSDRGMFEMFRFRTVTFEIRSNLINGLPKP